MDLWTVKLFITGIQLNKNTTYLWIGDIAYWFCGAINFYSYWNFSHDFKMTIFDD